MRPIFLSMKCFGPYRNTQTVDFEKFRSGIYLITGKTGTGKTTIFDGIMFALFEEASSRPGGKETEKGSVRDKTMLHSCFAPKSEKTEVFFRFESGGDIYEVRRTISFPKVRGTENSYGDAKFDAELTGPELSVAGSGKVTEEIERILNLDSVQFRQIVMLAQGQFRAFMEAKDNARKDILGKIFDSSKYVRLMMLLSEAAKTVNADMEKQRNIIAGAVSQEVFTLPKDLSDEERALYCPDHPDLIENITTLIASEEEKLSGLEQRIDSISADIQNLKDLKGIAEMRNSALDEFDRCRRKLAELEESASEFDEKRSALDRISRAVHSVRPAAKRHSDAVDSFKNAEKRMNELLELQSDAGESICLLESEAAHNPERQKRIQELNASVGAIRESLGRYDELSDAEKELKDAENKIEELLKELRTAEENRTEADRSLAAAEAESAELAEAVQECFSARQKHAEAVGICDEIKNLLEKRERLVKDRETVTEAKAVLERALKESLEAAEHFRVLDGELRLNQAGILAEKLSLELDDAGHARCPVCGCEVGPDNRPGFAVLPENAPSEEEVKSARAESEAADSVKKDAEAAYIKLNSDYVNLLGNTVEVADGIFRDIAPWTEKMVLDSDLLGGLAAEKEKYLKIYSDELSASEKKKDRKDELDAAVPQLRETAGEIGIETEHLRGELKNAQSREAELTQKTKKLGAILPYASREDAEGEMSLREKEAAALSNLVKESTEKLSLAREQYESISGRVNETAAQKEEAKKTAESAKLQLSAMLEKNGFPDEEDYLSVLPKCSEDEYEGVIDSLRNEIAAFDSDRANTRVLAESKAAETKGYVRTDPTGLEEQIKNLNDGKGKIEEEKNDMFLALKGYRIALAKITDAAERKKTLSAALARLQDLSTVANGIKDGSGKHAFDGYALSRSFEEVLLRATEHLDTMTGGRYTLVHEESGKSKSSAADFVIYVEDHYSGQRREIGSISGGEGFQVSMALALGLSDTAQSHVSGGRKIESLFIDEGFGTLDDASLGNMIAALRNISEGNRLVGIISHVDALREYIGDSGNEIRIKRYSDDSGSYIVQD